MNKLLSACIIPVFALGFSAPSWASDTFDAMLGNTVHVISADGAASEWMFHEDGTLDVSDGRSGNWKINGDRVCSTLVGVEEDLCADVPKGKIVGDTWEQVGADGTNITVTIKAGQ